MFEKEKNMTEKTDQVQSIPFVQLYDVIGRWFLSAKRGRVTKGHYT